MRTMTDTTHAPDTTIGVLRRAGGWFLAASLLWWIAAAALIPAEDYFYAETAREEALSIADNAGLFRAFHVVATIRGRRRRRRGRHPGPRAPAPRAIQGAGRRGRRRRDRPRRMDRRGHHPMDRPGSRRTRCCGRGPPHRQWSPPSGAGWSSRSPQSASSCRWSAPGSWPDAASPAGGRRWLQPQSPRSPRWPPSARWRHR